MTGRIEAICISRNKGEKKAAVARARFVAGHGLDGDAHAGDWHRQVSLLAEEDIEIMRKKGLPDLQPGDFAENVVVSSIDISQLGLGTRMRLGAQVEITLTQLGKVCHQRCAIYEQTGDCIMPSRGVFARVRQGGELSPGDEVSVVDLVPRDRIQAVVLTISDRCSRGETTDTAGPAVRQLLTDDLGVNTYASEVLADEQSEIADRLRHYSGGHSIDLVMAVGGTGFASRDVTPEAVRDVVQRLTPGLDEAMRTASLARTPHAMLSRAVSGICGSTLIISLPGSQKAATENLQAVLPALGHGLAKLRGDPSDCGRPAQG